MAKTHLTAAGPSRVLSRRVGTSSSCLSLQVLHEPLIDEDPVFITTCTERELRKRKKRKFSLWVRQCTSTGFICQVRGSWEPVLQEDLETTDNNRRTFWS